MAATQSNVDPVTTNEDEISQPMMKISHTNLRLIPSLDVYPSEFHLIVQILNNFVLSFALSGKFSILMEWLSLPIFMTVFKKTTKVLTFQISSSKTKKFTWKQFA
ncbi:unnamed protein product [Lactuca virosa]|uniref:Uncharacterized protein n=1 Tax=Lactuca virosa TaxID=75947 RepID=A0AAU9PKV5_9ASTR|nr:unnamed protein product [Lactuca virosa]